MKDQAFERLIQQAMKVAARHYDLMDKISNECIKRYGYTYSEVDADGIIDAIDYGAGDLTVESLHKEMIDSLKRRGLNKS